MESFFTTKQAEARLNRLVSERKVDAVFSSPGRAEILGNHTDHQGGKVIVASIDCDVLAAVECWKENVVEISSEGYMPIRVDLNDLEKHPEETGRSISMVRGVLFALSDRGYAFGGFSARTDSTIFRGAGVSSSAAFELLIVEIVNVLYLDGRLTPFEKAEIARFAESEYFGKPCGLLDQCGIAYGGMNRMDFQNTEPTVERLTPPSGYRLVLTNTGGSHSSLTEHYAAIRTEMESVAACFQKKRLRDVPYFLFLERMRSLRGKVSDRALLRALHYFDECHRVDLGAKSLKNGRTQDFLSAVSESGRSSTTFLQNAYVPGSDVQGISLALALSEKYLRHGASRLHGGGFSGTVLSFVPEHEIQKFVREMGKVFGEKNVFIASIRSEGTCLVK